MHIRFQSQLFFFFYLLFSSLCLMTDRQFTLFNAMGIIMIKYLCF